MQTPVKSNRWSIEVAEFVVVTDGLKPLIDRDLFDALGIAVTQTLNPIEGNMVNNINTQCPVKNSIANQFPNLVPRIGRSKVHIVISKFQKRFQPKHQKDRRVHINLLDRVNTVKTYIKKTT